MRSIWADLALAVLSASMAACVAPPQSRCHADEQRAVEDTLYFGTRTPTGVVTTAQWDRFLADVVTPRFPRGLTVSEASGQWSSAAGPVVRESTHVLQLVHPDDAADAALIARIIAEYKSGFSQESVLRVKVSACVAL